MSVFSVPTCIYTRSCASLSGQESPRDWVTEAKANEDYMIIKVLCPVQVHGVAIFLLRMRFLVIFFQDFFSTMKGGNNFGIFPLEISYTLMMYSKGVERRI